MAAGNVFLSVGLVVVFLCWWHLNWVLGLEFDFLEIARWRLWVLW